MTVNRRSLAIELGLDRVLAHQTLFTRRHGDATPPFHVEMITDFHGDHPRVQAMAFRGGAKSTIYEEGVIIKALYREFRNCMVVGASIPLAAERLESIRHELETNETIEEIYGRQVGPTWTADEIVLANGVRIISRSRGQAMRGTKFHDSRPDFVFVDDIEDDEDPLTTLRATKRWFWTTLLPALDAQPTLRMAVTPVHIEALAEDNRKDPSWLTRVYPIKYRDEAGHWKPTWPARFPLWKDAQTETSFRQRGMGREYSMEYMCQVTNPEDKVFSKSSIDCVAPQVRTWQAVYCMVDPARTIKTTSATTGFAAWSWIAGRLVVWEAWGRRLLPDEIVREIYDFAEREQPVWVGVEEDGLNEFLLQPIRAEGVRRGVSIPVRAEKAPRGKLAFIRGLQPYFMAREVTFAKALPDLEKQLLGFPHGDIDVPNALAYALKMKPATPIYDNFGTRFIDESRPLSQPAWLALNASPAMTTAVVIQAQDGVIRVLADYVREGDADEWVERLIQAAQLDVGRAVKVVAGPFHYDRYANAGLVQAVKRIPMEVRKGVDPAIGRAHLRSLMTREARGQPLFRVSEDARWTLNALAGGYARAMTKGGVIADYPEEGPYRLLMEGLESFAGLLRTNLSDDDERTELNYAFTPDGRRYLSALAVKRR